VRGEVHDDADVGLVEAEVQARAVQVVQLAELVAAAEITQLVHRRVVLDGVAGHQHQVAQLGRVDDQLGLGGRGGQRLLDEDALACLDGLQAQPSVGRLGSGDDHRIDVRKRLLDVCITDHIEGELLRPSLFPVKC
jgi:hypothetical protein